ncbi:MAG TPA: hypothetical protein VGM17_05945 [Rhizomicrobium sp.]|jgi:hypothetical protein
MSTPKPQVRSTFATPLCVHYLPVAAEVNAELKPLVLEKMSANGAASARGQGWRSKADVESWGGGAAQTLFRMLRELADSLTATRAAGRVALDWRFTATAAVRHKGDYLDITPRHGAFWAGVYFIDDGYNKSDSETLGGECELADPRGALPAMIAPQYAFRIPGGVTAGMTELIRPSSGMILLHPAWMARGERRFDGEGTRITVEFEMNPP